MHFLVPFFSRGSRPCHSVRLQEIPFSVFVPEVVDALKVDFEAGQVSPAISHGAYPVLVSCFGGDIFLHPTSCTSRKCLNKLITTAGHRLQPNFVLFLFRRSGRVWHSGGAAVSKLSSEVSSKGDLLRRPLRFVSGSGRYSLPEDCRSREGDELILELALEYDIRKLHNIKNISLK